MTGAPVRGLILALCLPAVISNLVTTAYNLADTYFIGRLGTSQSGAIGIAYSVMTVFQAFGFFFGNGSGNSMSRELGKRNTERAARLLAVGFCGAVLGGCVLAVIGLVTLPRLVVVLGSTPTIAPYAIAYLTPILLAAPMVCGSFALNGLLRYQGLSLYGMIGLVTGALLNFLVAPFLIFVVRLGIAGAGIATAICQTISFILLVTFAVRRGVITLDLRNSRPDMLFYSSRLSFSCGSVGKPPFSRAGRAGGLTCGATMVRLGPRYGSGRLSLRATSSRVEDDGLAGRAQRPWCRSPCVCSV